MSTLGRRFQQLLGQSRIRLPRRPPDPSALGRGDRIGIGSGVWRIRGRLLFVSGSWAFLLEPLSGLPEGTPTARLLAPGTKLGPWTLIRGEERLVVPPESVVIFFTHDSVLSSLTEERTVLC